MSHKVEPVKLYPNQPRADEVGKLENRLCEDNALIEKYGKQIPEGLVDGLTREQKRYYHVIYTKGYFHGIRDALALFIGMDNAKLFIERAKTKHEKVYAAKEAKAKKRLKL